MTQNRLIGKIKLKPPGLLKTNFKKFFRCRPEPQKRQGNPFYVMNPIQFLGEVKAELAKVVWPTRKETIKYTITVIVFSIVIALVLGLADLGILSLFEKVVK